VRIDTSNTAQIKCDDGYPLALSVYASDSHKGVVIIASAIGVPQSFYRRYAQFLCRQGYAVITFDYRGTGDSICPGQNLDVRIEDWGTKDVKAVIEYAKAFATKQGMGDALYYVGHSIGGQILGLADNAGQLSRIVMVAASAAYWGRWPFPANLKMWFVVKMLIPMLVTGRQAFPAKRLGLGDMVLPAAVVKQWARWMGKTDYLFCKSFQLDVSNYPRLRQPILLYGFEDDELVPPASLSRMLRYFPGAPTETRMVHPESMGQKRIGHSGFFRDSLENSLWLESLRWLDGEQDSAQKIPASGSASA